MKLAVFSTSIALVTAGLACSAPSDVDPGRVGSSESDLSPGNIHFEWSHSGRIAGLHCVEINEPADRDGHTWTSTTTAGRQQTFTERAWKNNFLCTERDYGLKWSYAGPLPGMHCLSLNESAEPGESTWADNYLCSPVDYKLTWSTGGPVSGQDCVRIDEPWDRHTWGDNYLCQPKPIARGAAGN